MLRNILKIPSSDINKILGVSSVKEYLLAIVSIKNSNNIPVLNEKGIRLSFEHLCFSHYHFSYCSLAYACFNYAKFKNSSFSFSNLCGVQFGSVTILGELSFASCNFDYAILSNFKYENGGRKISFSGCSFNNTTFRNIDITQMTFEGIAKLTRVILNNVTMSLKQINFFLPFSSIEKPKIIVTEDDFNEKEIKEINSVSKEKRNGLIIGMVKEKTKFPIMDDIVIIGF